MHNSQTQNTCWLWQVLFKSTRKFLFQILKTLKKTNFFHHKSRTQSKTKIFNFRGDQRLSTWAHSGLFNAAHMLVSSAFSVHHSCCFIKLQFGASANGFGFPLGQRRQLTILGFSRFSLAAQLYPTIVNSTLFSFFKLFLSTHYPAPCVMGCACEEWYTTSLNWVLFAVRFCFCFFFVLSREKPSTRRHAGLYFPSFTN